MITSRCTWNAGLLAGAILGCLLGGMGCATESNTPRHYIGGINVAVISLEQTREIEESQPAQAKKVYEEFLAEATSMEKPFGHYQEALQHSMRSLQGSSSSTVLSEEAVLGFPYVYARQVGAITTAHLGLARVALTQGDTTSAEAHVNEAMAILRAQAMASSAMAPGLRDAHRFLQVLHAHMGRSGRELIAKLNANLLDEYLKSEAGVRAFYEDKILLYGEAAQKQVASSEAYVEQVNSQREASARATQNAIGGGLMMAGAAAQSAMAQQALVKSGGVVTPQVQQMQMNAQMAQFQVQMFTAMVKLDAGQTSGLDIAASPWGVPTFAQQLVNPKMGMNSRTLVKGFATAAATAGGTPTLTQGAQQVISGVEGLPTVQSTSDPQAIMKSVESFSDVFNAFLTQVQEIQTAK